MIGLDRAWQRFGYDDVLKDSYKDPAVFWDEMLINDPICVDVRRTGCIKHRGAGCGCHWQMKIQKKLRHVS